MRSFGREASYVFVRAIDRSREALLTAAARVKVKPASLQGALPSCVLVTEDDAEAVGAVAEARAVGLEAWVSSLKAASQLDRATRVTLTREGVDLETANRVRRVTFTRLLGLIDLRWKGHADVRLQVVLPDDAAGILVSPEQLIVEGPSRQGALLRVQNELQRHFAAQSAVRVHPHTLNPVQLGLGPDVPAELVAVALTEDVRRLAAQGAGRR